MAMDDFLADLGVGGVQGAGAGASILGGLGAAKVAFPGGALVASNPWVAGGLLGGGALLGALNTMDPAKRRTSRLNEKLGKQELESNALDIEAKKTQANLDATKRHSWDQFGNLFSGYLGAMAKAKPTGMSAFEQGLGG